MFKAKLNDAISVKTFVSYVIAIIFFFVMNVVLGTNVIDLINVFHWYQLGWVKFLFYTVITTILVLFGIERPGIAKFFVDLFAALRDGKLSAEEKLYLIESATDNIFSQWANLSAVVKQVEEKVIEKNEPDITELHEI